MIALAMGVTFGGYAIGLWGWCLLRGYDVSFIDLINPVHPYSGKWPPPPAPNTVVFPSSHATPAAKPPPKTSGGGGGGGTKKG